MSAMSKNEHIARYTFVIPLYARLALITIVAVHDYLS